MKYKYDKKDNLLEKKTLMEGEVVSEANNVYDEENRLIKSDDKTYSYDNDGNQIKAGETNFDYMTSSVNGKNVKRLKSVYESGKHVASYSYTLEGQRTGKYLNSGQSEISYHYSGKNVQYERWSSGRTVRYTHPVEGGSSCSSCGCGGGSNVFTDHPISIEVNGTKHYYLYNGQGSVTELINGNEEVVNKYRYTPFGSSRLKMESVYNPYQYTGRRLDDETGQYYYIARMYSAEQARFTSQDPAGMQEGPNMYAYVGNNPVNKRDPSGMHGGPPPAMIDGSGGGSGGSYYTECPDAGWDYFAEYVNYNGDHYYEPEEICLDRCWDIDESAEGIDVVGFLDCLGIYGAGTIAGCIAALIGIASAALATALTFGLTLIFCTAAVIGAATSCGFAAYEVDQCT